MHFASHCLPGTAPQPPIMTSYHHTTALFCISDAPTLTYASTPPPHLRLGVTLPAGATPFLPHHHLHLPFPLIAFSSRLYLPYLNVRAAASLPTRLCTAAGYIFSRLRAARFILLTVTPYPSARLRPRCCFAARLITLCWSATPPWRRTWTPSGMAPIATTCGCCGLAIARRGWWRRLRDANTHLVPLACHATAYPAPLRFFCTLPNHGGSRPSDRQPLGTSTAWTTFRALDLHPPAPTTCSRNSTAFSRCR